MCKPITLVIAALIKTIFRVPIILIIGVYYIIKVFNIKENTQAIFQLFSFLR